MQKILIWHPKLLNWNMTEKFPCETHWMCTCFDSLSFFNIWTSSKAWSFMKNSIHMIKSDALSQISSAGKSELMSDQNLIDSCVSALRGVMIMTALLLKWFWAIRAMTWLHLNPDEVVQKGSYFSCVMFEENMLSVLIVCDGEIVGCIKDCLTFCQLAPQDARQCRLSSFNFCF